MRIVESNAEYPGAKAHRRPALQVHCAPLRRPLDRACERPADSVPIQAPRSPTDSDVFALTVGKIRDSAQLRARGFTQSDDGMLSLSIGSPGMCTAVGTEPLASDKPSYWTAEIIVGDPKRHLLLGITLDKDCPTSAYKAKGTYAWSNSSNSLWRNGQEQSHGDDGGWNGFQPGDVATFKFDHFEGTLSQYNSRSGKTFVASGIDEGPAYILVDLFMVECRIRLRAATDAEKAKLP